MATVRRKKLIRLSRELTRTEYLKVRDATANVIASHMRPFSRNVTRIRMLLRAVRQSDAPGMKMAQSQRDDVLRAAVVFLHASVEEVMRVFAEIYLPISNEDVLDRVPLAGSIDSLRAEKFFLGRLVQHRGKTVDQLIESSVREHLKRRTFSSVKEIVSFFESLGFDIKKSRNMPLADIDRLMKRRHEIVHRADVQEGKNSATPIDLRTVERWLRTVERFVTFVCATDIVRSLPAILTSAGIRVVLKK
jgi:hypothetical protein